jgi:hypothetical protein
MVVGECDAIDSGCSQKFDGTRLGPEMKCLRCRVPFLPFTADDAFQVDQATVGVQHDAQHIAPERFRAYGRILDDVPVD